MPMSDDIRQWLEDQELGEYADAFAENRVDASVLPTLTNDDLKDIGVLAVGDRRRLLNAIAVLSKPDSEPILHVDELGQKANSVTLNVEALRRQISVLFADISSFTKLRSECFPVIRPRASNGALSIGSSAGSEITYSGLRFR